MAGKWEERCCDFIEVKPLIFPKGLRKATKRVMTAGIPARDSKQAPTKTKSASVPIILCSRTLC